MLFRSVMGKMVCVCVAVLGKMVCTYVAVLGKMVCMCGCTGYGNGVCVAVLGMVMVCVCVCGCTGYGNGVFPPLFWVVDPSSCSPKRKRKTSHNARNLCVYLPVYFFYGILGQQSYNDYLEN